MTILDHISEAPPVIIAPPDEWTPVPDNLRVRVRTSSGMSFVTCHHPALEDAINAGQVEVCFRIKNSRYPDPGNRYWWRRTPPDLFPKAAQAASAAVITVILTITLIISAPPSRAEEAVMPLQLQLIGYEDSKRVCCFAAAENGWCWKMAPHLFHYAGTVYDDRAAPVPPGVQPCAQ